jgi:DNA invertase Pin-like site-specific DNA recombinase
MKCATYHRVSTTDQNPTLAREELRSAATRLGMELVEEIEETGSGARNDRPGLQRVLAAARSGKIDAVLTWKVDRFARSVLDLCTNVRELVEVHGCAFYAVSQGLVIKPGGEATSRLLLNILGAVSEFEREIIRERTRLGLGKAKRAGKRLGRPTRKLSPTKAQQVQRLRSKGYSWSQVAEKIRCSVWAARSAAKEAAA